MTITILNTITMISFFRKYDFLDQELCHPSVTIISDLSLPLDYIIPCPKYILTTDVHPTMASNYILMIHDLATMTKTIQHLVFLQSSYCLIITNSTRHLKTIFSTLWGHQIVKMAAYVIQNNSTMTYSWNPLETKSNCGRNINLKPLTSHRMRGFPKLNCFVKISAANPRIFKYTTLYVLFDNLIKTCKEKLSLKFEITPQPQHEGEYAMNKTFYRLGEDFNSNKFDLSMMYYTKEDISSIFYQSLDISNSILDFIFIYVYPKLQTSKWASIIKVFTPGTYLLVLFTASTSITSWYLFTKITKTSENLIVFKQLQLLLGSGVRIRAKSASFRFLVFFILIHCFYINLMYQSKLNAAMTAPSVRPKIETEVELLDSDIPLYLPKALAFSIYGKQNTSIAKKTLTKAILFDPLVRYASQLNKRTSYHEKSIEDAIEAKLATIAVLENYKQCQSCHKLMYYLPIKFSSVVMLARKRYPVLEYINRVMRVLNEAGFTIKLVKEKSLTRHQYKREKVKLEMEHVLAAFYLLILGLFLSGLLFLLEWCHPPIINLQTY